jgi:hypothetical protein
MSEVPERGSPETIVIMVLYLGVQVDAERTE